MSDNYRLDYRGLQVYDSLLKEYIENKLPKIMTGATRYHDGTSGLTPIPLAGQQDRYLKADGTWATIPSFVSLYDFNEESIEVGQNETEISFISCSLLEKADLEGHFTMSLYASETCDVHVRIKDDNVEEIFVPQIFSIDKGYHSFGIPHAYIGKNAGLHNFTVTIQCTNGTILIPTRGILYTIFGAIDGSYINDGIDILDIAIKRTDPELAPSEIWSIGFDDGGLLLRKNEYNNPNGNKWVDVFDYGQVLGGAIEFYGSWIKNSYDKYFMITEDIPHVFVIDSRNNLYDYYNNVPIILASGVSHVSACLGYNSAIDETLEQGLICAYVKTDGNVYYREFKHNFDTGTDMWFAAEELYTSGDANYVTVNRLPDYRIGILVKHANGNKWFITNRTFIGNTYKKEVIKNTINNCYNIINMVTAERINDSFGLGIINECEQVPYHNDFSITFEGALHFVGTKTFEDLKNNIRATRNGVNVPISDIEINDNVLKIHTTEDVKGDSTFVVSWNMTEFVTTNVNGSRISLVSSYTWYLPTYVDTLSLPTDYVNIGFENCLLDIDVLQIAKPVANTVDNIINEISGSLDINVGKIENEEMDILGENISVSLSVDADIDVVLVGTSPV